MIHAGKWNIFNSSVQLFFKIGLQLIKSCHFVQFSQRRCFNSIVQSVIVAKREGDGNPLSGFVEKTMKVLSSSTYENQIWIDSDIQSKNIAMIKRIIRHSTKYSSEN